MKLNPLDLLLDPHNPRLRVKEEGSDQPELRRIMLKRFKLEDLAESMIASGFLEFDPIVAVRQNGENVVLEGNRRVATAQLLLKPELAPDPYKRTWKELSARLPESHRASVGRITVAVHEDRNAADLRAYTGFRHVTGVLPWPALEKASFIALLVHENSWSYEKIAERLGSYPKHVERYYVAHQLVEQARGEGIDTSGIEDRAFGVLMRALQTKGIPEFLGITFDGDPRKAKKPIPKDHLEDLKYFVQWAFGTKDQVKVLGDSRDLTKFGRILQSHEATGYLKRTERPSFDRAYFRSGGQQESLAETLASAADNLQESVALVSMYKTDKEIQELVERCADFLMQILAHFPAIERNVIGSKKADVRGKK